MTLPEVQAELLAMADRLDKRWVTRQEAARLRELVEEMYRRPYVRRTPPANKPLTPLMKRRIAKYAWAHPDASYQQIANHFMVNTGRVSETLAGKRT